MYPQVYSHFTAQEVAQLTKKYIFRITVYMPPFRLLKNVDTRAFFKVHPSCFLCADSYSIRPFNPRHLPRRGPTSRAAVPG